MSFTEVEFLAFFAALLAALAVVKGRAARQLLLLGASYWFYACWDWRFLALLVGATAVNYLVALGLDRTSEWQWERKGLLLGSLGFNLGLLGVFKYCNFFCDSLQGVLRPVGLQPGTLHIVLPLGISFYVFQMLSYVIDVYRGQLRPCRSLLSFALFTAFFPKLIAGPIVRGADFLPQLRSDVRMSWGDAFLGFRQFTVGLFKKVFIADRLTVFVSHVFDNAGAFDAGSTWLAVLAYGVQIYCDFSGYSDMAIGTARILGYRLPENFQSPYLATSITDFWRRWHITLSTWLRDYLYIPLGGNRKGPWRTYFNLLVTMILGGLWHGASWTFVCWGAIHGGALVGDKWLRARWQPEHPPSSVLFRMLTWSATMLVVFTAWVFFRASSFEQAFLMLRQMYVHPGGILWLQPFAVAALLAMVFVHLAMALDWFRLERLRPDRIATPVVLFSLWWLVWVFRSNGFSPFVYTQF